MVRVGSPVRFRRGLQIGAEQRKRRSAVVSVTSYRFGWGQIVDSPVGSGSAALTSLVAGSRAFLALIGLAAQRSTST
jgi:hypothetical protein